MKNKVYLRIEELPISNRSIKALTNAGFKTEIDFETVTERDLLEIEGFGAVGLAELKLFLKGRGIKLFKVKKERKVNHPKCRDLIRHLLKQKPTPREIALANKLLEQYTFDELSKIKVEKQVGSLSYFLAGAGTWLEGLIHKHDPQKLLKTEIEFFRERELKEILPDPEPKRLIATPSPMSLEDFFKTKK